MSGFLNPYNFIAFPEKKENAYEAGKDKHTGMIEYTITTRSPLFIPNTGSDKAFTCDKPDHGCYDFYSYTELDGSKRYDNVYHEPVIPGSELRGMLRSVYETLTDSCMGVFNEDIYPTMRINEAYKPALIKRQNKGVYQLVDAEDCIYRKEINGRYENLYQTEVNAEGSKVYFNKIERNSANGRKIKSLIKSIKSERDSTHSTEGYLIKGMEGPVMKKLEKQKHNCHVFVPKKNIIDELTEQDILRLIKVLEAYQNEPQGAESYKEYQEQLNKFIRGEGNDYFPVYYSKVKKYLYLAPACFTKEIAYHSLKDVAGEMVPCKKLEENCPCCDLFGMVGENNEQAGASKIRFADAKVAETKELSAYFDEIVTLEALGSPKVSNIEFYLKKPQGADFWNYDYFIKEGKVETYDATLRGRKYYWHQKGVKLPKDVEKTGLNKTIRPVKSGNVFKGKLFYEGISEKQLNQLLWILNGGNEDEQPETGVIAYKLGMGKPLGLGSVELKVVKIAEREISLSEDSILYQVKEDKPLIPTYEEAGFVARVKKDFFTIASLDAAKGLNVSYPVVEGQKMHPLTEGFTWFMANHDAGKMSSRESTKRICELPTIEGIKTLPMNPTNRKMKQQTQVVSGKSNVLPRKNDVIICKLISLPKEDRYHVGQYFAYVEYQNYKGIVQRIPNNLKRGEEIKVKVYNFTTEKFTGDYVR